MPSIFPDSDPDTMSASAMMPIPTDEKTSRLDRLPGAGVDTEETDRLLRLAQSGASMMCAVGDAGGGAAPILKRAAKTYSRKRRQNVENQNINVEGVFLPELSNPEVPPPDLPTFDESQDSFRPSALQSYSRRKKQKLASLDQELKEPKQQALLVIKKEQLAVSSKSNPAATPRLQAQAQTTKSASIKTEPVDESPEKDTLALEEVTVKTEPVDYDHYDNNDTAESQLREQVQDTKSHSESNNAATKEEPLDNNVWIKEEEDDDALMYPIVQVDCDNEADIVTFDSQSSNVELLYLDSMTCAHCGVMFNDKSSIEEHLRQETNMNRKCVM